MMKYLKNDDTDLVEKPVPVEVSNLKDAREWMKIEHPFLLAFLEVSTAGYWLIVIWSQFMRIFKHKALGWVDVVK